MTSTRFNPRRSSRRRGAIFIIALAMMVILSALLMVFAQEMRTESATAANRLSSVQADAIEQGAEQWVMAQVEANTTALPASGSTAAAGGSSSSSSSSTTAVDLTTIPAEALSVGGGYFWLLHPDPTQDQTYDFGIVDESSKVNINSAAASQLIGLPNMTQAIADSIVAWNGTATGTAPGDAATSNYYSGLEEPYQLKAAPYETVEELMLIQDITPQVLFGYDLNHDGILDDAERTLANGAAVTNGSNTDSRGFFNYVTCYSTNAQPSGTTSPATTSGGGGGGRGGAAALPPITVGLINVNTAPKQTLMSLAQLGLTESDVDTLISTRTSSPPAPGSMTWVATALAPAKANAITRYITATSYQYSADIVAVSGDGRSFKRVRIVVDCRTQPAKIVYRKDISNLGWPLDPNIRDSLRSGQGIVQTGAQSSNGFGTGLK